MIELSKIRIDGGTQPRVELSPDAVAEYRDALKGGAILPPVTLFFDGAHYWLADGFHRFFAAKEAGQEQIVEDIIPGTQRDAILFSLSANSKHGLKRTNEDKRRAVHIMLGDSEWAGWSSNAIAKQCAVSNHLVEEVRRSYPGITKDGYLGEFQDSAPTTRTVQRNGTTYEQNTTNIGQRDPACAASRKSPDEWKKTAPEAKPEPSEEEHPEYTTLDEAMDTVRELQDALALANAGHLSLDDKTQAADLIARLREEVRILTLKLKAVTASRDQYQTENGELKKQITRQRREIDKLAGTRTA